MHGEKKLGLVPNGKQSSGADVMHTYESKCNSGMSQARCFQRGEGSVHAMTQATPLSPCWENGQLFQSPVVGERWAYQEPWLGKAWTEAGGTETCPAHEAKGASLGSSSKRETG